jgi:radical SAM superfamily enzyme YgiQ (UPF0313 family)
MITYARKKGIFVAANYIIGFPTETWEEIRETIKFSEEINADYTKIFIAIPLRNTEMFDLAQKTKSLIMDPLEADTMWTVGGVIKSDHWSADDLTILRAYEWDRINFTDPKKAKKIADKMGITMDELNNIRKKTLNNARETVSKRQSSGLDSSVKRAADIALVTLQSSLKKEKKKIN